MLGVINRRRALTPLGRSGPYADVVERGGPALVARPQNRHKLNVCAVRSNAFEWMLSQNATQIPFFIFGLASIIHLLMFAPVGIMRYT